MSCIPEFRAEMLRIAEIGVAFVPHGKHTARIGVYEYFSSGSIHQPSPTVNIQLAKNGFCVLAHIASEHSRNACGIATAFSNIFMLRDGGQGIRSYKL